MKKLSGILASIVLLLAGCGGDTAAQETNPRSAVGLARPAEDIVEPDIVGGKVAPKGAWPYAAFIELRIDADGDGMPDRWPDGSVRRPTCGGSLIGARWVLTAAHCTSIALRADIWIGAADRPWAKRKLHYRASGATDAIWTHPGFRYSTMRNDVALIRLDRAAPQQKAIFVLPDDDRLSAPGVEAAIIGWGRTTEGGPESNVLLQARVPVIADADCAAAYPPGSRKPLPFDAATMFCAGRPEGGVDACQGDSGGPILVPFGTAWLAAGVVSWGEGCARAAYPGVYSRLGSLSETVLGRLQADSVVPVTPPTVGPAEATDVQPDGARVDGSIQTRGLGAIALLEIRAAQSDEEWATVAMRPAGSNQQEALSFVVEGLEPDTTYEYRVSAVSATGHITGSSRTFETAVASS